MRTYASQFLSTDAVAPRDAAQLWTDLICETFVRLAARPAEEGPFHGTIRREVLGELEFATVTASGQNVFRTQRYAATASDEFLLFSIQRQGRARICQDGRTAELNPGEIALYDSARPYSLHFAEPFQQLVVQIPKSAVDVDDTRTITAQRHAAGTPGGVIASMLLAMGEQVGAGGAALDPMVDHVLSSLAEILATPEAWDVQGLPDLALRRRAEELMRDDLADPEWTVARLAQRCHLSVRTLYRLFPESGVAETMRGWRIERAKQLLSSHPELTVAAVAHHCGFGSESGFIRAFRAETGASPGKYVVSEDS